MKIIVTLSTVGKIENEAHLLASIKSAIEFYRNEEGLTHENDDGYVGEVICVEVGE